MTKDKITIIGAGLCGSLLAIRMAQKGLQVEMHERRPDMRKETISAGRSINLALSSRGIEALKMAGIEEEVKEMCIPMTGRMIHPISGPAFLSPYSGRANEHINSISRGGLNIALLNKAESYDNVSVFFNSSCTKVDLENAEAFFTNVISQETSVSKGQVVFGTDGAASVVRKSMMSKTNELMFNFSQQFLSHGYKELSINPTENGGFRMDKNALHIWPRGSFMIIALPNLDGSFTVTMFHPFDGKQGFNQLTNTQEVESFFKEYYEDMIQYMPNYVEEFFSNPTSNLATIKCYPWQAFGKSLLMGDAAHAVVPFYGQGMNASFEDVRIFDELHDTYGNDWNTLFKIFQEARAENTNAIADLAIDNFLEMRDRVDDLDFIKKRKIEMQLEQTYTDYFSKYSLVTFRPEMPYSRAMRLGRAQDELLLDLCNNNQVDDLEFIYKQVMELQNKY